MSKNTAKKTTKTNTAKKTTKTSAPLDIIADVTSPLDNIVVNVGEEIFDTPTIDTPAIDTPAIDTPAIDTPAIDTPAIDTPAIDTPAIDTSDVIFHNVAASQPAQVSAVIVPPTSAAPTKVERPTNLDKREAMFYDLAYADCTLASLFSDADSMYQKYCTPQRLRAIQGIPSSQIKLVPSRRTRLVEIVYSRDESRREEARLLAIKEVGHVQFLPSRVEGLVGSEYGMSVARKAREASRLLAESVPTDTLPASVPEFALAEQLAAQ